jgi:hypothetical protein
MEEKADALVQIEWHGSVFFVAGLYCVKETIEKELTNQLRLSTQLECGCDADSLQSTDDGILRK